MKYSRIIDQIAMSVARRVFKPMSAEGHADLSGLRRNPLFYPCLAAFTFLGIWITMPLDSVLRHLSESWLPSFIVTLVLILLIVYPIARFCTTLLALRTR